MSNYFIVGLISSIMYIIYKFIEMRFILKENKPLKELFRDTLIVYLSVISGLFVSDQFHAKISKAPQVFTDMPNF
jgi:hypothetical protein